MKIIVMHKTVLQLYNFTSSMTNHGQKMTEYATGQGCTIITRRIRSTTETYYTTLSLSKWKKELHSHVKKYVYITFVIHTVVILRYVTITLKSVT